MKPDHPPHASPLVGACAYENAPPPHGDKPPCRRYPQCPPAARRRQAQESVHAHRFQYVRITTAVLQRGHMDRPSMTTEHWGSAARSFGCGGSTCRRACGATPSWSSFASWGSSVG
jgi:hypothetical protein